MIDDGKMVFVCVCGGRGGGEGQMKLKSSHQRLFSNSSCHLYSYSAVSLSKGHFQLRPKIILSDGAGRLPSDALFVESSPHRPGLIGPMSGLSARLISSAGLQRVGRDSAPSVCAL